jgi:amino acid adenylation domain-containing protein
MDVRPDLQERIAALSPKQQELLLRRIGASKSATTESSGTAIRRRPVPRAPLSFAQQRFWFLDQLDPGTPHYNVALAAPIDGEFDAEAMERSLNEVIRRHESLRTTFELGDDDETPVQVIHERLPVPLTIVDLRHLDGGERAAALESYVTDLARQPWDLATGPLVRTSLIRLAPGEQVLAATMHHIICDVWSSEIMLRELTLLYRALHEGEEVSLPEPPLQYADFAQWQREWLRGDALQKEIDYWREQLSGDLPPLDLPADRLRPAQQSHRGAHLLYRLPESLSRRLDQLCVEAKTTPFTLFLTAIATLLHRYSGQADIAVGSPVSNRTRAELEGIVGYLGNTLMLRTDLSGDPTFIEALRRAHNVALDAFDHQNLPFERVVDIAQPGRDLSQMPLLQVMFVYNTVEKPREEELQLQGLGETLAIDNLSTKFDLTFAIEPYDGTYRVGFEYSTDLFDTATIERMAGHWESLLSGVAADPHTPIGSLPLLGPDERRRIVVDWNATETPFPRESCLHELFDEQAARTPDAIAARDQQGELTYAELRERANRLAHHLRRLGAGPDVPVAICAGKSVDVAVGLLGIVKAGSAYLPLDAATPPARMAAMLAEAQVPLLLTQARLADRVATDGAVRTVLIDRDLPAIEAEAGTAPESGVTPEHLAYVIHTSGSTGRPKGVMLDHRGRVNNFHDFNTRFGIGPADRVLALAALNFDMSAFDVFGPLMTGAQIVFPEAGSERNPAHWLRELAASRVTVWHSVPALLEMLVEYAEAEGVRALPDLRLVLLGGDWIPPTLPDRIRALAPGARVIGLGGATEVSMDSTIHEIGRVEPERSIPYGRPMANQRAYVLDANLQPVPAGVAGDLYLAGVGVGRGYLGDPALTAERFRCGPLPEEPGRVYRTGDRAKYRADGELELLGRADFQIKIRGWRIEPGEVQTVLRRHPSIREAVVVAHTDQGGARHLVAYALTTGELDDEAVRAWARERLPEYLVPSVIVPLDRFPLTANGKIDRKNLPAPPEAQATVSYVAPRTETERILAEVWQDLLGAERIGVDDNFFSLGGESIKAIQVIARTKKRGVLLRPKQLFQHQTIRELAEVAEVEDAEAAATAYRTGDGTLLSQELLDRLRAAHADFEDAYPLSPMQGQMLRNAVERPASGLYVIHSDYLFAPGGIDVDLLGRAWQTVVDRYPALRTSFAWDGLEEPVQIVHRGSPVPIEHHDLRGLSVDEQVQRQDEIVAADRSRGFDLARPELVRLHLLRVGDDTYKYLSSNHHIVLDGWSRAIVQQEVFAVYEALLQGRTAQLTPFRPFRDHIEWTRTQDASRAERMWRRHLDGFTAPTPLVAARGLPDATCTGPFRKQSSPLPSQSAQALEQFTRTSRVTANTVMQGAWFLLLSRYTGRRDVVLGVMSSGRPTELLDVETVVGVCINALPARTTVDPGEPLLSWLHGLQEQQVELREFEYASLDAIQKWQGSQVPLFESFMVFENYPWDGSLLRLADRLDFEHPLAQTDYTLAQFEFPLRVEVAPQLPMLIMHYYQNAFADETITAMIADWADTIARMVEDPQQRLSAFL